MYNDQFEKEELHVNRNRGKTSRGSSVQPNHQMTQSQHLPARGDVSPSTMSPSGAAPMGNMSQMAPMYAGGYPAGPSMVAPTQEVMNPTRVLENHSVVRYPIRNIYPTHVRNVRHHVCEYYCDYPYSESYQDCYHMVNHCGRPGMGPR